MKLLEQAREACRNKPRRIVFADAVDVRLLHAANDLKNQGLAEPILIGNPFELRDCAHRAGIPMPCLTIVDPLRTSCEQPFAKCYQEIHASKQVSLEDAVSLIHQPLFHAAMMVDRGMADICIAGNISTTGDVIRAALKVIGVAEGQKTVSSFFMMASPDSENILSFADAGVIPEPTSEQLADIAIDAAANYERLVGEPARVAMLSFSSKGSSKHPAAVKVADAVNMIRQRQPDLIMDGELQFDAAAVPSVAAQKAPQSPLGGMANVFVFPSLNAGNIGYKIAQRLGNYIALGPLLQGLKKPMHDLSRGCSADDIVDISVLASAMVKT
ncbi:Ethanolamine utilization protein EutD [BD1-7 clade bacterium]|uniref:phosphate acetyltransferase n=1 Tax=BD1-7 clade bacterium TaxID=2029982 RepID=A0A5S9QXW4_9GAMM|nr:Ethanolamine utilization protein EutD [BD1-7 clade bacterium]